MRETKDLYWMLPLMGFGQLGVFGVFAVYLPELFPTSLRSTGTSFCYNVGRFVAALGPFTLSKLTARYGGDMEAFRTAGLSVSLVLLVGIAVLPMLPETKDQPLPEEVYKMLAFVLPKTPNLKGIIIERDQNFPSIQELISEIKQVRAVYEAAA